MRKSFFHLRLGVLTLVVDMDVGVDKDKATGKGRNGSKGSPATVPADRELKSTHTYTQRTRSVAPQGFDRVSGT